MESLPEQLEIHRTTDGSPTICFSQGTLKEKMHNSQGALSESMYIYGHGLEEMLSKAVHPRVISVGMGLGYCEMIAIAMALRDVRTIAIWSFESDVYLRRSLRSWLNGQSGPLNETYDQILLGVANKVGVPAESIKSAMSAAEKDGSWQVRRAFPADSGGISHVNCVLFDAYSSKTSPELWEGCMLKTNFAELLAEDCVFVTYAATGVLNRTLVALNFTLEPRAGFGGKRQSTFALRGAYAST